MRDMYPEPGLQEQALRELTSGELRDIETVLQPEQQGGTWGGIISEERENRVLQLKEFWKLPDTLPSPKEEYLGVYAFFADARAQNVQGPPITDAELMRFPIQRDIIKQQSEKLADRLTGEVCDIFEGKARAAVFIENNLEQLLLAPRVHAVRNYVAAQHTLFRGTVPQKPLEADSAVLIVDEDRTTGKHLETAVKGKEALAYTVAPYDFFQLNNQQKHVILTEFLGEVQALAAMTRQAGFDKRLLCVSKNRTNQDYMPLAYLSPLDLRQAIREHPGISAEMIYRTFFESPRQFGTATATFETLQQAAEQKQAARQAEQAPALLEQRRKEAAFAALSPNEQERVKLLQDTEVNPAILELQPGDSINVTELDAIMPGRDFERVVEKHMQLLGRSLYASLDGHSTSGVDLHTTWYNPTENVGARLRKGSLGALRNLRITWAPMSTEEIQGHFKSNYNPRKHADEAVMKLIIAAEIKNSGIAEVLPVSIQTVLSAQRMPKGKDRITKHTSSRVEGQEVVESRWVDAETRALRLYQHNFKRPHLRQPMGYGANTQGLNRSR
jgi:hypothetical protein